MKKNLSDIIASHSKEVMLHGGDRWEGCILTPTSHRRFTTREKARYVYIYLRYGRISNKSFIQRLFSVCKRVTMCLRNPSQMFIEDLYDKTSPQTLKETE